jgi:hypothetical protein
LKGEENRLGPATTVHATVALSFVIPSEADLSRRAVGRSAVPRTLPGSAEFYPKQNCHLDRSVAKWRDLRFYPESEV